MNKKFFFAILTTLLLSRAGAAQAAEPPSEPILRIETGMHTVVIRRIGIDAANRWLVTGSDDKTVRVWELESRSGKIVDARLVRVLRPPVGEGDEGKVYAVAISPDGKTIAAGGWTQFNNGSGSLASEGHTIYLFDRESGSLIQRITGLPSVIDHLAYSKNSRFLAATLGSGGIRVYRTSDYSLAGEDSDYGSDSNCADFDESGRLVTASYDGYVRLYDSSFTLIAKVKSPGGTRPFSVSFSPDGSKVAVGFNDSSKVDVLSGKDLSYLFSPDLAGVDSGDLSKVSWSSDGAALYAGGRYPKIFDNKWFFALRKWSNWGRGGYVDLPASSNTIGQILPLKSGGVIFGAADPAFGVIDRSGRRTVYKGPAIADYRGILEKLLISRDGSKVRFGYELWGKGPALFSVSDRQLKTGGADSQAGLKPPRTSFPGLVVTDWKNTFTPKLNNNPLKLKQYERSRSLAISPDGRSFLLGTEWHLRLFDSAGSELWNVPVPGVACGVNISGDGKIAVAAFGDGTIRWYRMTDGKELFAFFPHNDRKRWVLWTPSGYYAASAGGDDLIGWHINNGKDHAADFFPASKFQATYYRPDVLAKVLVTLDEGQALRLANEESGRKRQQVNITQMLPPVVTIISPADGASVSRSEVTVRFSLRAPSGEPITNIRAMVDGRPVAQDRGIRLVGKELGSARELRIRVPEQDCEISIIAENRYSASVPATVRIAWAGKAQQDEFVIKPKLYVLAVGVSKYEDQSIALGLPAKDAKDFAHAMALQKGGLYRDVSEKVLTDEDATKDNILDGLDWIQHETTSKDVAMVFFAGHGVNDNGGVYYYLPVDANVNKLKRTGVIFADIKTTLSQLAGKTLFFIDTCHSGNVMGGRRGINDITGVINELTSAENGAVVFASSTGNQYSLEDPAWGNGAFTKALVEGINGKADYMGKGKISINELDLYLSERVKELTKGRQTPTTTKPQTVPDFPVAVKR
jgi:WD40 repeat protein